MRRWAVATATAILIVQVVDILARFLVEPGWIFAFLFFLGAPLWLVSFALLGWMARGMFLSTSAFAAATKVRQSIVLTLLWTYLLGLTTFCWFMSDGGDADDWQSPAGLLLGVDGYNSHTPDYLNQAQALAMPALALAFLALFAATIVYATISTPAETAEPAVPVDPETAR
ncbi:hypothetical protein AB0M22_20365 [Nocardia sp. NPDC051756]|uniref:hypothetical protein n=1 Tax=Nocardia sp. NPDC051756 TaxID=3154751 RepID=UPI003434286D